jgi:hypothetical protein
MLDKTSYTTAPAVSQTCGTISGQTIRQDQEVGRTLSRAARSRVEARRDQGRADHQASGRDLPRQRLIRHRGDC